MLGKRTTFKTPCPDTEENNIERLRRIMVRYETCRVVLHSAALLQYIEEWSG